VRFREAHSGLGINNFFSCSSLRILLRAAGLVTGRELWANDELLNASAFFTRGLWEFDVNKYVVIKSQTTHYIAEGDLEGAKRSVFGERTGWPTKLGSVFDQLNQVIAPVCIRNLHWALLHAQKIQGVWVVEWVDTYQHFTSKREANSTGRKFAAFLSSHGESLTTEPGQVQFLGFKKKVPQQADGSVCGYAVMRMIADHVGKERGYLNDPALQVLGGETPVLPHVAYNLVMDMMHSAWIFQVKVAKE